MKDPTPADVQLNLLLAQDSFLNSIEFEEHRRVVLEKLAEAQGRERRARRSVVAGTVGCFMIFIGLYAGALMRMHSTTDMPEWIRTLVALIIILSPLTALVLFLVYFFRYRLEFLKTRQQARHQALLEMPHQIASLRKEIEELRVRLEKPPGDKTTRDAGSPGFTLIEMLVTIVILGILFALLLPALQSAKTRARINTCRNHLRQMGHALMMYESDFSFFPGAGDALIGTNNFPWQFVSTNAWTVRILPYLAETKDVFSCPDYEPHLNWNHTIKSDSFGYNAGGSCPVYVDMEKSLGLGFGRGRFIRLSDLKSPSDMIAAGDLQAPDSVWLNIISPWHKQPLGSLNSIIPSRHAGGANMLFADSHVEWALQARWIAETASARLRWNNDHEPHPETW